MRTMAGEHNCRAASPEKPRVLHPCQALKAFSLVNVQQPICRDLLRKSTERLLINSSIKGRVSLNVSGLVFVIQCHSLIVTAFTKDLKRRFSGEEPKVSSFEHECRGNSGGQTSAN